MIQIPAEALIQVYLKRPDLQAVYNADGTKKDPKNPSPNTLMDWAQTFGLKEEPSLDPRNSTLSQYFTPEEIKGMPDDIKTGLAAFADVQQKNFESGKAVADINAKTWADALNAAANDPSISTKYGDELKTAIGSTNVVLKALEEGYTQDQAKLMRDQELQRTNLSESEAAAGRAYSGFRKQAEEKLAAEQGDVIKSSRRQIQGTINSLISPLEQRYGTDALRSGKIPVPNFGGFSYESLGAYGGGDITGTVGADKKADTESLATDFYNTTETPQ